ncbi:MAG: diaminopimelate epimerase [Anaerovoracaceae bacterium]
MKFWKMNGAGNDFIIIDNIEEKIPAEEFPRLAKLLCERHFSLGADGLMAVEKPTENAAADYRMLFFNSDGSMGEMCGNGARCICRYGYEKCLAGPVQRVETTAGIVTGERIEKRLYRIRLNDPCNLRFDEAIEVDGRIYSCSYVELGNPGIPHCVVPLENLRSYSESELLELGRRLRNYKGYPKGANVNFCEVIGPDLVFERTYERGVEDFTYACGTGTGSVVTILTMQGKVSGRNVQVDMRGGRLTVDVEMSGDMVENLYLTGPTNIVAKGEITDEDL